MAPSASQNNKRKGSPQRDLSPPPTKRKVQSSTTQNAVANFFTPASEKQPEKTSWSIVDGTVLRARYRPLEDSASDLELPKRRKVACFDLDGTLIRSASGRKFSKDGQDWTWWHALVLGALNKLDENGYQIVVFSNQGGIKLDNKLKQEAKRATEFKAKINAIMNHFKYPVNLYAATARDQYRKPRTGMWRHMKDDLGFNDEEGVNLADSFFVGDAAGRIGDDQGDVNDFASSDRDFAANIGIHFCTPEEYFLGQEAREFRSAFDYTQYLTVTQPRMSFKRLHDKEVVLFCGSPGAGKSTFYQIQLAPLGYERINQDILKTRDKCLKTARDLLENGSSVAIDNTNATIETRSLWIDLAKSFRVPIRCVLFTATSQVCQHNEAVRSQNKLMNPEDRTPLPRLAFTSFASHYQPPALKEGFEDILTVDFTFQGTAEERALWAQHYL